MNIAMISNLLFYVCYLPWYSKCAKFQLEVSRNRDAILSHLGYSQTTILPMGLLGSLYYD